MLPNLSMLAVSAPLAELTEKEREKRREDGRQEYIRLRVDENESQALERAEFEIAEREELLPDYFVDWTEEVSYERNKEFERLQYEMENKSQSSADGAASDTDNSDPMDISTALQKIIKRQDAHIVALKHWTQHRGPSMCADVVGASANGPSCS